MINNNKLLYLTAFTSDYKQFADRFVNSCKQFDLECLALSYRSLGSWQTNHMQKAKNILKAIHQFPDYDIMWFDADSILTKPFILIPNIDLWVQISKPASPKIFNFQSGLWEHNVERKLHPWGTNIYFRMPICQDLIEKWQYLCDKFVNDTNDEQCLMEALKYFPELSIHYEECVHPDFNQHTFEGRKFGKYPPKPKRIIKVVTQEATKMRKSYQFIILNEKCHEDSTNFEIDFIDKRHVINAFHKHLKLLGKLGNGFNFEFINFPRDEDLIPPDSLTDLPNDDLIDG